MKWCPECKVRIEGTWARCPLCAAGLEGSAGPSPLPSVPLVFSHRRLSRILVLCSLAVIAVSLAAQLLFARDRGDIGVLRSVWMGLAAMWLVVVMAVRTRRNIARGTVSLMVVVGLVCVYWDYLTGWPGWSLTYAVPIVSACSIIAVLVTVGATRMAVGDRVLYIVLTVVLGLFPVVFLLCGWVSDPGPSLASGLLALTLLAAVLRTRRRALSHELARRLHL
jgi:hypothetical protein